MRSQKLDVVKVGMVSLGCPKNLVDGEVMLGLAREAGHEITTDTDTADVIVVNTCAFIDAAKEESIDAILEMARLKTSGRCRRLIVTGCLAERYRDELRAEIPEVDVVLGTGEVPDIVGALGGQPERSPGSAPVRLYTSAAAVKTATVAGISAQTTARPAPTYLYGASTPRVRSTPRHYAYVKVAEGCDYTCAFCIIPTLRGAYRSRSEDSIVAEADALAAAGVRELLLISQDTTFFGVDRGERDALPRLLRRLNAVPGLAWIRLLYLYPTTITDAVLDAMAECDKVCRYIDLPLQHASGAVLGRMRRPGTRTTYDKLLARIRARLPGVALRTTFIVGFPGETESDVDDLAAFVEDAGFDHLGVFTYSHEEGTRAHALVDDVPARTKAARRQRIMRLQHRLVARRQQARIGTDVEVLVDGPAPDAPLVLTGRLASQAPDIDSMVVLTDCDPSRLAPGDLVRARITGARGYDLIAAPTLEPSNPRA